MADPAPAEKSEGKGEEKDIASLPTWLGNVRLEDLTLDLLHPKQVFTLERFSASAKELFQIINLQTGSIEKKNSFQAA